MRRLSKEVGYEYGIRVKPSGLFWMPPNGYCGWHTNSNHLGERFYLVWVNEDNKSFFRYENPNTGEIVTKWEKKGWQLNRFHPPQWHCVASWTDRISIGFRTLNNPSTPIIK